MQEYIACDGMDLAELIVDKQVNAEELLDLAIERMSKVNPSINAVILTMFEEAKKTIENKPSGFFSGIPFLLKDLGESYKNTRLTSGSKLFKDFISSFDSELVKRYKQAGLVVFGKTNTPEFGLVPITESELLGSCNNPWNLHLTPGGSSGGSAAAVSSRIVPIAHGSDGGGSIRTPASCCGVFGLKPTRGRVPHIPNSTGISCEHVLTRSVRDSAKILDLTSQAFTGTPYWVPQPKRPFISELGEKRKNLRIAYSLDTITKTEVHKDCIDATMNTVDLLKELGHKVEEDTPNFENFSLFPTVFLTIWAVELEAGLKSIQKILNKPITEDMVESFTWDLYNYGKQFSGGDYLNAVSFCQQMTQEVAKFFKNYDLWLTPTLGEPPVPLGTFNHQKGKLRDTINRMIPFIPFPPLSNVTGQPAMSIPLYWNSKNIPIGSHFMGKFGDESTLFNIAGQLEEIKPWKSRSPDV